MSCFLLAHFLGDREGQEQIYFSVSHDGLHYQDLNSGQPVITSNLGTKGVRDPFLVRDERNEKFYLIATDLNRSSLDSWDQAIDQGSTNVVIWESEDLIYWSGARLADIAPLGASNLWAPEAIYDSYRESYFIYFASKVDGKHKIYGSYTKDFYEFSEPFLYLEKEKDIIDTTIFIENNCYYRFSKDETVGTILLEKSDELIGDYQEIVVPELKSLLGVEGPEVIKSDNKLYLFLDYFKEKKGYLPFQIDNLDLGQLKKLTSKQFDMGNSRKRHGGFLEISDREYQELMTFYKQNNPVIKGLYADPDLVKFGKDYYIYPTTDGFDLWGGAKFEVLHSKQLQEFTSKGVIVDLETEQVPWAIGNAWAPCIIEKDGSYFFYFCGKRVDGESCIGVAWSQSPIGPFVCLKEPLLTPEIMQENHLEVQQVIDPSVYEEDGNYFLLFGNSGAAICELNNDLISIKEKSFSQYRGLVDFREAIEVFKQNNRYHFTWSCDDTRDENYHVNYGVSENLRGPIKFLYPILEKNSSKKILGTGHHSFLKDQTKGITHIAYQRFASPIEKYRGRNGYNREICISPVKFDKKGLLQKVIVD
ncbi:family 43 glycosylhydrolase [Enterococcus casseliflavus]|uniref:family 43 glycosylhydrolase n=1 Tax=Enterococcus casseliflavus TaxID=37734 RepID=UPI003D6A237E